MKKSVKLLLSILMFSLTICVASAEHNNYLTSTPDNYYYVIKNDNSLWKIDSKTFESVKVMDNVKSVSRYLVLKEDGTLWELDKDGNYIKISDDVESISQSSTCVLKLFVKTDKSLWGYGWGHEGLLGKNVDDKAITPVKIMDNVEKAEAGDFHSVILKTDGSVLVLGANDYGALGVDKSIERTHDPIKVFEGAKDINAGSYSSFVFTKDDTLWRWGTNYGGWIGLEDEYMLYKPTPYIENAKAVQSHSGFNMVLKNDGTLWMYGETEDSKKALTELHGTNYPEDGLFGGKDIDVGVSVMKDVNSISDWNQANHDTLVVKNNGDLYVVDVVLLTRDGHWEVRSQKIMEDVHLKEYKESEEIESIAFSVNITPIKNSKYCYNCIFDKKVEIEYIMQLLNSFILIDDNEVINGGEIPIVNIYIKLKNGTTKNIGFISGRYFDSTGKQYAVDYKEYQKFVDTIYALKSGDLRTPMYSMGLPKEYLVNTQIYTNISKKIIETVIFMLSR